MTQLLAIQVDRAFDYAIIAYPDSPPACKFALEKLPTRKGGKNTRLGHYPTLRATLDAFKSGLDLPNVLYLNIAVTPFRFRQDVHTIPKTQATGYPGFSWYSDANPPLQEIRPSKMGEYESLESVIDMMFSRLISVLHAQHHTDPDCGCMTCLGAPGAPRIGIALAAPAITLTIAGNR